MDKLAAIKFLIGEIESYYGQLELYNTDVKLSEKKAADFRRKNPDNFNRSAESCAWYYATVEKPSKANMLACIKMARKLLLDMSKL